MRARRSTRTAEIAGVLNSSAMRRGVPATSRNDEASKRATNRTAFVLNASPPGAQCVPCSLVLCALDVRPVLGHDHDPRPRADMRGHGGAHAVGENSRLIR